MPTPAPAPTDPANPAGDPPAPGEPDPAPTPEPFTPVAPTDLTIPEGMEVSEPLQTEFLDLLNNQDMSIQERANALLALQAKAFSQASEAGSSDWNALQDTWQNEVRNDPEIGGAKFEGTMANVAKLVEEFGDDTVRQAFDITGAGNNPAIIRFLNKIAGQVTEQSTPAPGLPGTTVDVASRMFPSMKA